VRILHNQQSVTFNWEYNDMADEQGKPETQDDGSPKFGRLLIVLFLAVIFVGLLTWIMETYFPDFPNFG
jgi:hypothetical protein